MIGCVTRLDELHNLAITIRIGIKLKIIFHVVHIHLRHFWQPFVVYCTTVVEFFFIPHTCLRHAQDEWRTRTGSLPDIHEMQVTNIQMRNVLRRTNWKLKWKIHVVFQIRIDLRIMPAKCCVKKLDPEVTLHVNQKYMSNGFTSVEASENHGVGPICESEISQRSPLLGAILLFVIDFMFEAL